MTRLCLEIDGCCVTLVNVMSITHIKNKLTVAAVFAIVMNSLPLAAQTADISADLTDESDLLAALSQAEPIDAVRLDGQLQTLWEKSGSASMDLLLKRGQDALEVGDIGAAIEHLTALTDHAPDFAEGWHARASAYFMADLMGPAVADLERALALNPNNYNAMIGLGTVLEIFGDPKRAYQAYQRAQAIHPHHEEVVHALERLKPEIEGEAL